MPASKREKVTNWPVVPGSAVKGVLADHYRADEDARNNNVRLAAAFGKGGEEHSNSGSLVFTDARLVCIPVRSLYGTFAWCTSPLALERLLRDLEAAKLSGNLRSLKVEPSSVCLTGESVLQSGGKVFFEDLDFKAEHCANAEDWAGKLSEWIFRTDTGGQQTFKHRLAIVADEVFNFLTETGTEVTARVRIDDNKKTVVSGALWYEESLPAETVLAGLVWCDRVFGGNGVTQEELLEEFCSAQKPLNLQIGGKATVGCGRVECNFVLGGTS